MFGKTQQPQWPGTYSSYWSPINVGWHCTLVPVFDASQQSWLCSSFWHKQHAQADHTGVQWGWGQDCCQGTPSSQVTKSGSNVFILEEGVWLQTVVMWDCHWLRNLISICLCVMIDSNATNLVFHYKTMSQICSVEHQLEVPPSLNLSDQSKLVCCSRPEPGLTLSHVILAGQNSSFKMKKIGACTWQHSLHFLEGQRDLGEIS